MGAKIVRVDRIGQVDMIRPKYNLLQQGQSGSLSHAAGHDINYIALTGALYIIGRHDSAPTPLLNLVGDFEGGGLMLIFGVVSALYET